MSRTASFTTVIAIPNDPIAIQTPKELHYLSLSFPEKMQFV